MLFQIFNQIYSDLLDNQLAMQVLPYNKIVCNLTKNAIFDFKKIKSSLQKFDQWQHILKAIAIKTHHYFCCNDGHYLLIRC